MKRKTDFRLNVTLDRDAKKPKVSEWPAEFIVHSRDNSKNFLLKKFSKILKNERAHQQFRHKIDIQLLTLGYFNHKGQGMFRTLVKNCKKYVLLNFLEF